MPDVPELVDSPLPTPSSAVVFQPGDVVEVKFRYWAELDELQAIRPDGMISLQLVDEVLAAGKTPLALREELLRLYEDTELLDPEIVVIARVQENRNVYVGGEVNTARNSDGLVRVPLVGTLTPWEAVLQAGGVKERTATLSNVVIVRRIEEKQYARKIDLRDTFKTESEPLFLQPNDIIYVPRNKTDRMNLWIDQYLSKTVPTWVNANIDVVELIRNNGN